LVCAGANRSYGVGERENNKKTSQVRRPEKKGKSVMPPNEVPKNLRGLPQKKKNRKPKGAQKKGTYTRKKGARKNQSDPDSKLKKPTRTVLPSMILKKGKKEKGPKPSAKEGVNGERGDFPRRKKKTGKGRKRGEVKARTVLT